MSKNDEIKKLRERIEELESIPNASIYYFNMHLKN
jgi:hypothetical protein